MTGAGVRARAVAVWLALCAAPAAMLDGGVAAQKPLPQLHQGKVRDLAPGRFLVAARHLPDPNFSETVVLLADFGPEGAMGLIVNRPTGVPLSRLFSGADRPAGAAGAVYVGGPVAPEGAVALRRSRAAIPDARRVFGDVHLITTRAALEAAIAAGADDAVFRVYLGYSGWSASQLEAETAMGAWHVFPADADVVFDPDPETAWDRQIARTHSLVARAARDGRLGLPASPRPR